MAARLTSRRFVGRAGQLAELELAWREVRESRASLVLLAGESGVGKTRLIGEFVRRIETSGEEPPALVLRGEGVQQGETELPYAPLLGALRPLGRDRDPVLDELSAGARAQLTTLLPALGDPGSAARDGGGSGQLRLFEALLELIDRLGARRPLLVVLEDMHWADRSTRTFVEFAARGLREERVMLLLSYRSDELHRRHPLRPLIGTLERLERARRLELASFDRDELAEALADILGDDPGEEVIERLFARSEGNPLYSEELLAAGLDGRGAPPQSLQDAFMLRVERLSPEAQRVARVVAVAGRQEEPVLATVAGTPRERLQADLREAIAQQVLVAREDGRLAFRHALLREVVYDDLLPGERSELHLALARALESLPVGPEESELDHIAAIAGHYAAAGEQSAALRATVQAASAASCLHACGEAADLLERALQLWPRVAAPEELTGADHVEMLMRTANAHSLVGDRGRAEAILESALDELGEDGDPLRRAEVLGQLAQMQWGLNKGREGMASAQRALDGLPQDPSAEPVRVSLLAWLTRTQVLRGRFREAVENGEPARAAAIAAGAREVEGDISNTLGMALIALGRIGEGVALLRRSIELARENDDPDRAVSAYTNLADLLDLRGCTEEALAVAREGLLVLPRYLAVVHDWMNLTLSQLTFELGDWEAARRHLDEARPRTSGRQLIYRLLREAELALGVGDEDLAARSLGEAAPLVAQSSEPQWIGLLGALQAELERRRRDLLAARGAVARALDRLEVCTDDVMRVARLSAVGVRVEADIAVRARDLHERAEEREALERARIHLDRLRAAAQDGGEVEPAWLANARADRARGRGRNDCALWEKAAAEWDRLARPYPSAIARWHAAEAAAEAGDRPAAETHAGCALELAQGVGARWLCREIEGLAERARLGVEDLTEAADDAQPEPVEDPFGLTPRERQVLALIVEGATNRQIGAALYMAEKTASVHVSRILAKLGVRSRTQAAAVAHRLDLAG